MNGTKNSSIIFNLIHMFQKFFQSRFMKKFNTKRLGCCLHLCRNLISVTFSCINDHQSVTKFSK